MIREIEMLGDWFGCFLVSFNETLKEMTRTHPTGNMNETGEQLNK